MEEQEYFEFDLISPEEGTVTSGFFTSMERAIEKLRQSEYKGEFVILCRQLDKTKYIILK